MVDVISKKDNIFSINLPIFPMENGKFIFEKNITRVMIDIGTSWNAPNSVRWLNRHPDTSIVIGCEPSPSELYTINSMNRFIYEGYKFPNQWFPNQYKSNDLKNRQKQHALMLEYANNNSKGGGSGGGGKDCPYLPLVNTKNYHILPVAISNKVGYEYFNTSGSHAGVGSLLDSKLEYNGKRLVPVITLDKILECIPLDYVEFLKIDAQGKDEEVILSAGDYIKKCAVVSVEILDGQYHGEVSINIVEYMKKHNFELIDNKHGCRIFLNNNFKYIKDTLDYDLVN